MCESGDILSILPQSVFNVLVVEMVRWNEVTFNPTLVRV